MLLRYTSENDQKVQMQIECSVFTQTITLARSWTEAVRNELLEILTYPNQIIHPQLADSFAEYRKQHRISVCLGLE